jgi:hypothetical protein
MRPIQSFQSAVRFSAPRTGLWGLWDAAAKAAEQNLIPAELKLPPGSPVLTPAQEEDAMNALLKQSGNRPKINVPIM